MTYAQMGFQGAHEGKATVANNALRAIELSIAEADQRIARHLRRRRTVEVSLQRRHVGLVDGASLERHVEEVDGEEAERTSVSAVLFD